VSGFTRDPYWYGGRLVYEPLPRRWQGYHDRHCPGPDERPECTGWWVDHALDAGFEKIDHHPYYALVGPGLTEGVDEGALTTDALWEAVTGKPGQGWREPVREIERVGLPRGGCEACGGALRCKAPRSGGWLCAACNEARAE
jgi:hypothetical protein